MTAVANTTPTPILDYDACKSESSSCIVDHAVDHAESSTRPTSVPDYDVGALANVVSLRHRASPIPLDLTIPIRTGSAAALCGAIGIRAAFVFFHVDGCSSVAEIAASARLPITITIECILELVSKGGVELGGGGSAAAPPASNTTLRSDRCLEPQPSQR